MTKMHLAIVVFWSAYLALLILLGVAHLHRRKLIEWATQERRWLSKESEELQVMRKFLMQQNTWDETRGYYGNPLMNAAFDTRVDEYNRRRAQLLEVIDRIPKLLPW